MLILPLLISFILSINPINLVVSPHFVTRSHPDVRAIITIVPDERNRVACLIWDSENEAGSHCWEHLDENDFPAHTEYPIKLHYLGMYEFTLVLQRTDKIIQSVTQEVEVN